MLRTVQYCIDSLYGRTLQNTVHNDISPTVSAVLHPFNLSLTQHLLSVAHHCQWCCCWHVCRREKHGEAAAADAANVQVAQEVVPKILEKYGPENSFNYDETGLNWRRHPTKTLGTRKKSGTKLSKERMTIALACNASGSEKLQACVVHNATNPRAFVQTRWQVPGP